MQRLLTIGLMMLGLMASKAQAAPVAVLGDSLADGLWMGLVQDFGHAVPKPTFERLGKISSGLTRPGFYDWPAKSAAVAATPIAGALMMIGMNDGVSIENNGHFIATGTPDWTELYRQRIDQVVEAFTSHHHPIVWVGLPPMRSPAENTLAQQLNKLYAEEVPKHGGVFLSIWSKCSDHQAYAAYLQGPDGPFLARADDGVHFSPKGYLMLGHLVASLMPPTLGLLPPS